MMNKNTVRMPKNLSKAKIHAISSNSSNVTAPRAAGWHKKETKFIGIEEQMRRHKKTHMSV